MKKRNLLAALILTLAWLGARGLVQAQESFKVEKIKPNVVRLSGATEAFFSPSGKFLAVQTASKFFIFSVPSFSQTKGAASRVGRIIGFSPSENLIYSTPAGIFAFEPSKQTNRRLFSPTQSQKLIENMETDKAIVIVSDELILTGDGSYDWGGNKGNVYRFDIKQRRVVKGAVIWDFWYASLSPSGQFVLYEHGAEANNNADLYDVRQNKNYRIGRYFNFTANFPEFEETDEVPIAWLKNGKSFLALISENDDEDEGTTEEKSYLALFNVPERKVVWKKNLDKWFFPTDFQLIDNQTALLNLDDGIYNLSLRNGELRKNPDLDGKQISVSPNGSRVALIKENRLLVAAPDGSNPKALLDLPAEWKWQTAYKGMEERPPVWSADNKSLILYGENEILVIQNKD